MGVGYKPVLWNPDKKRYDGIMLGLILVFWIVFGGLTALNHPEITAETMIIRLTGTTAIILLHVILLIGPAARIDTRFLPFLYNRRHLGVTMFIIALVHGVFSIIQFHALGDTNPILSVFTANTHYGDLLDFPFQTLGFFALLILFLMAASSHDFWLKNLGPRFWKSMHMLVYLAYGLLLFHVLLGIYQLDKSPLAVGFLGMGMFTIIGAHLWAAAVSPKATLSIEETLMKEGFVPVCRPEEIAENRAKVILVGEENIAIFKYEGKLSAIHNVCKHQNGPLGEGKIIDGCITCPWHGYQYEPHNGSSPPPFTERVSTYDLKLLEGMIWVNPQPYPEGTERPPLSIV